jgi:hypothetical protein
MFVGIFGSPSIRSLSSLLAKVQDFGAIQYACFRYSRFYDVVCCVSKYKRATRDERERMRDAE